jgi:hypothetical protein
MAKPRVPGEGDDELELPCGQQLHPHQLDLGVRELDCGCGASHAVVMDVHPLGRFVPEFLADTLRATITTEDEFDEFTTAHLLAMVREEYPEEVVAADCSGDGEVGFGLVWVADFEARELHRIVVELVIEMMEHAVSHAEDGETVSEFERQLSAFDVEEFVEVYRGEREFEDEYDTAI